MPPAAQIALPFDRLPPARPLEVEPAAAATGEAPVAWIREAPGVSPDLAEEWATLADAASEPNSFAEPWFVAASLAAFGGDRPLRLAEVRRGGKLIGVTVLAIERHYGRSRVSFVQNWCHHQLFLGTPLIRRGEETSFWSALLDALDEAGWASHFLHVRGLVEDGPVHRGLIEATRRRGRGCATVHRESRALLEGGGDPEAYYRAAVRPKKRKEIRRLQTRLAELGELSIGTLGPDEPAGPWCDAFLALEQAGWKGEAGSALACDPRTERFFRRVVAGAQAAGRLQFRRLDLDGQPIAMLVNFLAAPGSFSFKTCFDPEYARFSPGVLIQLDNLDILRRSEIHWMDSCAAEHHAMIDRLWSGRRSIVRVTVRLKGRFLVFAVCRALETGSAVMRRLRGRTR